MLCCPSSHGCRWPAKESYGRGAGLQTTFKDVIFRQPFLPILQMPPSSTVSGTTPAPATSTANPTVCGTTDCINHVGCFIDMAGGVRAVPTPALRPPTFTNSGWTALTCAAEAKKNAATVFAIQVGGAYPEDSWHWVLWMWMVLV